MTEQQKVAFCRMVRALVMADHKLQHKERDYLERLYHRLGLSSDERKAVETATDTVDDVETLLATVPESSRRTLLAVLSEAAAVDGEGSPEEGEIVALVTKRIG